MGTNSGQKASILPTVSSKDLSWAAETADGTRNEMLQMYLEGDKLKVTKPKPTGTKDPRPPIDVFTPTKQARDRIVRAELYVEGGTEPITVVVTETDPWDVVFWTESSIEKFLWPYYHSHRLWDDDMTKLQAKFDGDPLAVAIAHKAPSASSIVRTSSAVDVIGVARATTNARGAPTVGWLSGRDYLKLP